MDDVVIPWGETAKFKPEVYTQLLKARAKAVGVPEARRRHSSSGPHTQICRTGH